uniref:Uncharacterized protein n=1 Tax=Daphnia magna TaxID=35525 RepID=A0A0P6GDL4_9CRUS
MPMVLDATDPIFQTASYHFKHRLFWGFCLSLHCFQLVKPDKLIPTPMESNKSHD